MVYLHCVFVFNKFASICFYIFTVYNFGRRMLSHTYRTRTIWRTLFAACSICRFQVLTFTFPHTSFKETEWNWTILSTCSCVLKPRRRQGDFCIMCHHCWNQGVISSVFVPTRLLYGMALSGAAVFSPSLLDFLVLNFLSCHFNWKL